RAIPMEPIEQLVERLNRVRWRTRPITPDAEALIQEFLHMVRPAIHHLCSTKGINPVDAYGWTQTAGHASPEYKHAIEVLFNRGRFFGAGVREPLILSISAAYGWDHDPDLSSFPNPWLRLLKLFEMGYSPSGEDDPDGQWVQFWVGYQGGIAKYQIV